MGLTDTVAGTGSTVLYFILAFTFSYYLLNLDIIREHLSRRFLVVYLPALFLILCLSELYYFLGLKGGIWFCDPRLIGFWRSAGGFLLFTWVVYTQCFLFRRLLKGLYTPERNKPITYQTGLYTFAGVIPAFFLSGLIGEKCAGFVLTVFFIAQLAQLLIIVVQCWRNWLYMIANIVIYLLGCITFMVVLFYYLLPLMLIAVTIFVARMFFGTRYVYVEEYNGW